MDTSKGGKAIPLLFGIDAVHGQSNIIGATLFPHNIGLGATRNPELLRQIGGITAPVLGSGDWPPWMASVARASARSGEEALDMSFPDWRR